MPGSALLMALILATALKPRGVNACIHLKRKATVAISTEANRRHAGSNHWNKSPDSHVLCCSSVINCYKLPRWMRGLEKAPPSQKNKTKKTKENPETNGRNCPAKLGFTVVEIHSHTAWGLSGRIIQSVLTNAKRRWTAVMGDWSADKSQVLFAFPSVLCPP